MCQEDFKTSTFNLIKLRITTRIAHDEKDKR